MIKFIRTLFFILSVIMLLSLTYLAIHTHTFVGILLFIDLIILIATLSLILSRINKKIKLKVITILSIIFIISNIFIINIFPSKSASLNSIVTSENYSDETLLRYSIFNIIPESEQFNFGYTIMPHLDKLFTKKQSKYAKRITFEIYDNLEKDEDFKHLPSAMKLAYAEYFTGKTKYGHYFKMSNKKSLLKEKPLMIFLHGSLGNFKGYMWVLRKLAIDLDFVIISPSYGVGNWHIGNSTEIINATIQDALSKENIDLNKIYLCGISNGGIGVAIFSFLQSELISKIILLSPVMPKVFIEDEYSKKLNTKDFLIISGENDRRIPSVYIEKRVEIMRENNFNISLNILEGLDHFMFFAKPDSVIEIITDWVDNNDDFH